MYKILGGDGREYGPVTSETMRQWIREGRANAETQVLPEGAASWQALGTVAEFADALGVATGSVNAAAGLSEDDSRTAALRLATPAGWALFIVGILSVLMSIGLVVWTIIFGMQKNPFLEGMMNQQGMSDAMRMGQTIGYYSVLVLGVAWGGFITFAGVKLRRLESWGLVLTGAIFAVIPCCGTQFPLCLLSTPIGIWAIVVLCQSKVKSAFS